VRHVAVAVLVGALATALLTVAAYWSSLAGADGLSQVLLWPNAVLQALIPCNDIGGPGARLCEGTALNLAAWYLSFPVGMAVYSWIAYVILRRRRGMPRNNQVR